MAKGNITNASSQKLNNVVDDLKKQLTQMENKLHNLEVKNKTLEEKVERLLHRVGKIKDRYGKQSQDIIVKFKSHSAIYKVYKERKKGKNIKISPNLAKKKKLSFVRYIKKKWKVWIKLTLLFCRYSWGVP